MVGVKWVIDGNTITIRCYPKKKGVPYKLTQKTWSRTCPTCKKKNILIGKGAGKGEWGPEGGVFCSNPNCDADFCGVTGRDTKIGSTRKLTPASNVTSSSATKINDKKINDAITEFNEDSEPKREFKITIPVDKRIIAGHYAMINIPVGVIPLNPYFVTSVNTKGGTMDVTLNNYVPVPDENYTPPNDSKTSGASGTVKATGKAGSKIEQDLMNKGAELKTINKIYNYIRKAGSYGMKYSYYFNHIKGGDTDKFHPASAKYCINNKKANCTDFAWIFWAMCKGAGIKVEVWHGHANFPRRIGHLWNKYQGKIYDCSVTRKPTGYSGRKVI
ncbi:transglutaminase-like domain-containing protein [Methanobrevibacter curvatus]|uniref:Transglutaminase-like superfamily protein n=1 Tax=Methanobrevibacter curvatus TaxID=49547 RepID=A0A166CB30_9EURY|nr:transglutaminase-like domain-containing protein [Methanobrevibacter curvatus]KZX14321.1 transglutaminase-like superfamily protein [Methanobrevibacter curvatus]